MDGKFDLLDQELSEQYPDIKVISRLSSMKAAYYSYYGEHPEDGAFDVMRRWVLEQGLDFRNGAYRIFGYNAPDSDCTAKEYGYEVA